MGRVNYGHYANPAFDALFSRAGRADVARAQALYRQAMDTLNADAPALFLYAPVEHAVVSRRLGGRRSRRSAGQRAAGVERGPGEIGQPPEEPDQVGPDSPRRPTHACNAATSAVAPRRSKTATAAAASVRASGRRPRAP